MTVKNILRASLVGLSLISVAAGTPLLAETLRIQSGTIQRAIDVPFNRAIILESDTPLVEVSVANPNIADFSPLNETTLYLLGRTPGRTTLTLLGPEGELISNVEVRVTADLSELKERLREVLPGEPIEVRSANAGIVLSGTVRSAQAIDRAMELAERYSDSVSNLMQVGGTQQVMMKVRFAEVRRSVAKALNASLAATDTGGSTAATSGLGTGTLNNPGALAGVFGGLLGLSGTAQGGLQLGLNAGDIEFAVLIEALETKGLLRTLSEPNLTALSGQPASFLAGGEYPVPVQTEDGISVEYKDFGIRLEMTPRVVNDTINLTLESSVSAIDESAANEAFGITGFRTRRASTTVEMRDGESFAIAGLLQDDFEDLVGQVPWIGDVPVLGALFRSSDYRREQSELIIIVSAHLVTPTRGEALALPTDRVRPPSETGLFLNGQTARETRPLSGGAGEVARQDFTGSYGYVME